MSRLLTIGSVICLLITPHARAAPTAPQPWRFVKDLALSCLAIPPATSVRSSTANTLSPVVANRAQRPLLSRDTIVFNMGRQLRFHYKQDLLAPGTESRVFQTAENSAEIYRVPNADKNSEDLPQTFQTLKRILGNLMPDYLGRIEVSIVYDDTAPQMLIADVFTRIDPQYILPGLAYPQMSPRLRRKVAQNIERVRRLFLEAGYFPGDFGDQNYRVNPTTGEIQVMNDPGILRSSAEPGEYHLKLFAKTLNGWNSP